MKFKTISAADAAVLREARKVLKRLQKRVNKLDEKRNDAFDDISKGYKTVAAEEWRMLDELEALHIRAELNGDMSLEAQ